MLGFILLRIDLITMSDFIHLSLLLSIIETATDKLQLLDPERHNLDDEIEPEEYLLAGFLGGFVAS